MKKNPIGSSLAMALASGHVFDHVPWYRRRWTRKQTGRGPWFSANKRHQGLQECARRLRQIESGIIQKDQCL